MKTKKNYFACLLLALGLTACGTPSASASGNASTGGSTGTSTAATSGEHTTHQWNAWETTKEATCTEAGSKKRTCKGCSEVDTAEIAKKDHVYEAYTDATHAAVPATCATEGKSYEKCKTCTDIKEVTVAKTAHSFGDAVAQEANGATTASSLASCANCEAKQVKWKASDIDASISSTDNTVSASAGTLKLGGKSYNCNNGSAPEGGAEAAIVGSHAGYKVYVPGAAAKAKLRVELKTTSSYDQPVFAAVEGDQKPGYIFKDGKWEATANRYGLEVNGEWIELGEDPYGTVAKGTQDWFEFQAEFPVKKGVNDIVIQEFGGYRATIYNYSLEFVDESHNVEDHTWTAATAPTQAATDVALTKATCTCGEEKLEWAAMDANKVVSGSLKSGTKEGYMKLSANNNTVTYTFTLEKGFEGMLYQKGFMDSYSNNTQQSYYTVNGGNDTNFEITVNGVKVNTLDMKGVKFEDMFGPASGADADNNSPVKYCQTGKVELKAGQNTVVYKRVGSYNLVMEKFAIIGNEACSHEWAADAAHNVAPTCEAQGSNAFACSKCGKTKTEPVAATGHEMVAAEADATHTLIEGSCTVKAVTGWKKCSHEGCNHWEAIQGALGEHTFAADSDTCSVCHGKKVVFGNTALWGATDHKMVKSSSADFTLNIAEAGNYKIMMALKISSGAENYALSGREITFKVNDGDSLTPTNNSLTSTQLGYTTSAFNWGEITTLAMPAGEAVKLTIAFGANAGYRFLCDGASAYFVVVKA